MNVALLSQPQRELRAYLQRVAGDGGTVETPGEASTFIRRLRSAGVLGSTVLAGVAGGVKAGTLYSIIGPDLDVTRGTVKNRVNRAGVLSEVASGVPATDYAGGALRGTTVEPSAVNLALRSEEFDNAYWTPLELTVTPNTTVAPNGETTADTLTESANNAARAISSSSSGISFTSGTVYTFSVFAKFNGRFCRLALPSGQFGVISANFDLQNGIAFNVSGTGARIVDFGNGWYRCSITATATSSGSGVLTITMATTSGGTGIYQGDGTSGIFIWGAQLETGSVATSYIKTEGSAQPRNADVITKTGLGSVLPQTEGWVYLDINFRNLSILRRFLTISAGATSTDLIDLVFLADNTLFARTRQNNTNIGGVTSIAMSSGNKKILYTWQPNLFRLYSNGLLIGQVASGGVAFTSLLDKVTFANAGGSEGFPIDPIHSYAIGSGAITDASAIQLTTL
jgi:hypothetical protein